MLSVAEQGVRALAALVMTPVMVRCLGVADFGLWGLVTAFFAQFAALDLGLQSSMPKFLLQRDDDQRRGLASTALGLYGGVAMVGVVLTGIAWLMVPVFVHEPSRIATVRWVLVVLGFSNALSTAVRLLVIQVQCLMRQDLISSVAIVRVLTCSGVLWWCLTRRGGGLLEVGLVQAGGAVAEALVLAWFGRSLLKDIARRWVTKAAARRLVGFAGWSYLYVTSERLRSGLDGFVLGWLRGSSAAGIYGLGLRPVMMMFDTVYAGIGMQLLPTFGKVHEAQGHERLNAVFIVVTRLASRIAITAAVLVLALGLGFLRCWVSDHATEAWPVLACLALPLALQTAQVPVVHLLFALARHRPLAVAQAVAVVINLMLSWILAMRLGIVGAALGTAIEIVIMHGLVVPLMVRRLAGIPWTIFVGRGLLLPMTASLAALLPVVLLSWTWLSALDSWGTFLLAAMGLVLCAAGSLVFGGGRRDWRELKDLIRPHGEEEHLPLPVQL
ncbi:MAG: oligosaccharide flippase family protein [Verrucomicrobiaceae bacterium]|nr:oligosaccharide flippase family protein [Verrucomicrobiaceae bacterium]